jgi:tetratricopeptide (TPR) repeat protein
MSRGRQKVVTAFWVKTFVVTAVVVGVLPWSVEAASTSSSATESVVIEGSVSGSTISNTVYQENPATLELQAKALSDKDASEEQRRQAETKAAELATKLGFTSAAVGKFFETLGERDVPEEKVPARLIEIATHFAQTRDELAALEPDDPHAAALAQSAKEALDGGQLTEADALLEQAKEGELAALRQARELKEKAQKAEDRHALDVAKFIAGRGNLALTQLRYVDAAEHFKQAVELVPARYPHDKVDYLNRQADALYREGDERGDNSALREAIDRYRVLLTQRPRDQAPLDWASTQTNLGVALIALGERETGTAHLEEAVAAHRAALEVWTREQVNWPAAQTNLGNALKKLGERESGTAHLEEAVAAYRAALEVWTRDRSPLGWATVQNNLGTTLEALGERESDTTHLEEAVAAL